MAIYNSFNTFWYKLSSQQQVIVIWVLIFAVVTFIIYTIYLIITGIIEYNKPIHIIKILINDNYREGVDSSEEFNNLFSMLHTPFQSDILTIEIHKLPAFEGMIITTRNKSKVEFISGILTNMEGVSIEKIQEYQDPLQYFEAKSIEVKSSIFKSTKRYGNFKRTSTKFIPNIQKIIKELSKKEYLSIILTIRPVNLKQKLDIKIGELRYKVYDNKNKVPNQHKQHQIEKLTQKNEYLMYLVKPQIVASNKEVIQKLAGSFNLVSNENTLYQVNTKYNTKNHRFIINQSIFTTLIYWLGLSKSSYMNTKELGSWLYF
ncbi:MAG: hypothetical protein H7196_00375 [candidate division SR1 bacterium]|nr:hypothetical protein [candidate division SR1 bacterium]